MDVSNHTAVACGMYRVPRECMCVRMRLSCIVGRVDMWRVYVMLVVMYMGFNQCAPPPLIAHCKQTQFGEWKYPLTCALVRPFMVGIRLVLPFRPPAPPPYTPPTPSRTRPCQYQVGQVWRQLDDGLAARQADHLCSHRQGPK